jgi:undecaprenyl-diphosphatase
VTDFLYSLDVSILLFLNRTLSNPVSDLLWPLITDYDKLLGVRVLIGVLLLWLVTMGGRKGRTVVLLLLPLLLLTDKTNSEILKELFARMRPCHEVGGFPVVDGLRLLVGCGAGKSFPSSHAVNNFAVALLFTRYYPKTKVFVFGWAGLVALSRPAVGVHYPSDVLAGAGVGLALAALLISLANFIEKRFFGNTSGKTREDGAPTA